MWLLRFECAAIYGASGLSKLLDPDWFGGTVTWQRVVRARDDLEGWPLPDWALSVLTDRGFHTGAAKAIVLTELFIAVGLWWRGSRYAAVWVAVAFHVGIETSASVQVFSLLGIAVLVVWATPSTRDRVIRIDPASDRQRRWRAVVRGLDWLARFRVEPAPRGSPLEVVERDGTTLRGAPAIAFACSRLPLTAWFALPMLLLPGVRRARDAMIARRVWPALLTLALILAASFLVVAPPERCPSVTPAELRRSAQASVDWFVRNQDNDGTWLYLYDADDDSTPIDYNEVRHAGVAMGLYQAAAARLPGALRSADRGTEWAFDTLLERNGWAAVTSQGRVTTGATALLAAGLTIRREATGDTRHDRVLRRMGRFLVAQTEPSGAVLSAYDPIREAPVPGQYSKYYTGEAYWALARLHRVFPGEGWGETADRIGAYLAKSRDEVEDHWPPIPDHWAAYGAAETVEFPERGRPPLTEDEVSYARRQAELFGVQARWVAQRFGPWGELVRGSYTPRGGGYGVISEALTGWWLAARAEPRLADLREPVAERATCVAGLAMEAQSDSGDAAGAARPERVEGAWFLDGETRMDDQQHALAGLLRTIPIVEAAQGPTSPAMTRRRAGCGPPCWCLRSTRPGPRSESLAPGGRREAPSAWPPRAGRSAGSPSAPPRPPPVRCSRHSMSATPRSGSPPGSSRGWPAPSTCSGGRPRPNPRSPAGAPRSCRSRSRWWPAPPCSCWRWGPAPTTASS